MSTLKLIYKNFIRKLLATQFVGFLAYLYILIVFLTSKKKTIYSQYFNTEKFHNTTSIYVFWHGRMILMYFLRPKNKKTNIFISAHADGKIIGRVSKFFNVGVIWGSSNKNPTHSLKKIFTALNQKECLAITPDGPRGPAFEINSNIVKIASKYNLCIIPVTSGMSKKKVFRSWDKFMLPLPFGKLSLIYGKPIKIPPQVTKEQVSLLNTTIKNELNAICKQADKLVIT
ncbi:MAG: lysophospholipid acyltransferase family protein [Rickettsiales bacterium]|nr:lysophospholipid acyltransferase family protein [Rickettsiales bacterium]